MASVNKVILIGNVGKDPVVRSFENGKVANFSIAVTEKYTSRTGELVENTEWVSITTNGKLAEVVERFVKQGIPLYVEGKIHTRSYQAENETKYVTEVMALNLQLLGQKPQAEATPEQRTFNQRPSEQYAQKPAYRQQSNNSAPQRGYAPQPAVEGDGDLPF